MSNIFETPSLYVDVPEVMNLGTVDLPIQCSEEDILSAFKEASNDIKDVEDFSFESMLSLGSLPHNTQEVAYQIPSPTTLSALPSFTTADLAHAIGISPPPPPQSPPKPRFSTVKNVSSPTKVAFIVPLKTSTFEFREWPSKEAKAGSSMTIPVSHREVFGRINAVMAAKPKRPVLRKYKPVVRQSTLSSFKQRKPAARGAKPSQPSQPSQPLTLVHDVVFNNMLVCEA